MPTPQQPIGSGFGPAATAAEVLQGLDLSGRIAIVTGGSSGIGLETTRVLAAAGASGAASAGFSETMAAEDGATAMTEATGTVDIWVTATAATGAGAGAGFAAGAGIAGLTETTEAAAAGKALTGDIIERSSVFTEPSSIEKSSK